mgnify:CR=1 FL=1
MEPFEVMISDSQERMMVVVTPDGLYLLESVHHVAPTRRTVSVPHDFPEHMRSQLDEAIGNRRFLLQPNDAAVHQFGAQQLPVDYAVAGDPQAGLGGQQPQHADELWHCGSEPVGVAARARRVG